MGKARFPGTPRPHSLRRFPSGERQFLDRSSGGKIESFQVDPENIGAEGRFEKVDAVFLVRYGPPAGGGDIGPFGQGYAERDRNVAHYAENGGYGRARVGRLLYGIDIERGPDETVGRPVRSPEA